MKTTIKVIAIAVLGFLAFTAATLAFAESLKSDITRELAADTPSDGIGRVYTAEATRYATPVVQAEEGTALRVFCETDPDLPEWFKPDEEMSVEWYAQEPVKDIASPDAFWNERLLDSRGAAAERWEIEECIRELMLEAGGESDADIREHAAVYCKRLLYTQTVGGYDDWGTTLHEVVYSHGFLETYPYIWETRATPTDEVREIFWDVWYNGYDTDFRVQNFRSGYFASWSIPAYSIGNTFYGINPWQDFSMFE